MKSSLYSLLILAAAPSSVNGFTSHVRQHQKALRPALSKSVGSITGRLPTRSTTNTSTTRTALNVCAGVIDTLVNAWSSYNVALVQNPLLTKSLTAGIILGAADLAGQKLEK